MSLLTASLPDTVVVGGRNVPIAADFRTGIRFEQMTLKDKATPESILSLFYGPNWPQPYEEAIRQAIWFYRLGKPQDEAPEAKQELSRAKRSYDFDMDADALYTSFRTAYSIDLSREDLHWWAFRELMLGLPEESAFKKRVWYRTGSTEGMSQKQKKSFEAMRKRYAIPERGKIDQKLTLNQRDEAMKKYVAQRFREAYG